MGSGQGEKVQQYAGLHAKNHQRERLFLTVQRHWPVFMWYRGVPWCPVRSSRHSQGVQPVPKKKRLPLLCSPSSWSRSWLSASQASSHTHSTPCSVVCRSRRLNPKPNRSTAACKTVSRRSLRTKERRDSSRARWPTSCVALVQLSCSCCTTKL